MKKNSKNLEEDKNQELNEPTVSYQTKNRINFYRSFEEETEASYKYLASLSPEQHLANAKQLIDRIYSEELKNRSKNNKISFN